MNTSSKRLRVALIGLGKMGLSHVAILRPDPRVEIVGICDSSKFVLAVLHKYTGLPAFTDATAMLSTVDADAVVIATPTASHYELAHAALVHGASVFCEKPLSLEPEQSAALA